MANAWRHAQQTRSVPLDHVSVAIRIVHPVPELPSINVPAALPIAQYLPMAAVSQPVANLSSSTRHRQHASLAIQVAPAALALDLVTASHALVTARPFVEALVFLLVAAGPQVLSLVLEFACRN